MYKKKSKNVDQAMLYLLGQCSLHMLGGKIEHALLKGSMFLRKFGIISSLL